VKEDFRAISLENRYDRKLNASGTGAVASIDFVGRGSSDQPESFLSIINKLITIYPL
jgi:hypothetical protein